MIIKHIFHYAAEELGGAQKVIHNIHRAGGAASDILAFDYSWRGQVKSRSSKLKFIVMLLKAIFFEKNAFLYLHHRLFLPVTLLIPHRSAFVCHNIFPSKNRMYGFISSAWCIAISEEVSTYLLKWNSKLQIRLIPNGLPEVPEERHQRTDNDHFRVGFIGRLDRQKGIDLLFDAAANLVLNEGLRISLHLVGPHGELSQALKDRSKGRGLPQEFLVIHGYAPHPFRVVRNADLICIPSRYEGFGLVFYEALERNHFVLAANLPVFHTYDWDKATVFFDSNSVTSLIERLRECYNRGLVEDPTEGLRKRHAIPTEAVMAKAYIDFAKGQMAEIKLMEKRA